MKNRFNFRAWLAYLHDLAAVGLTWAAAYWLRFNLSIPSQFVTPMLQTLPWVVLLYGLMFFRFGLYRGIWRYASLPDFRRIITAVFAGILVLTLVIYMLRFYVMIPRSVLLMQPVFLIAL